MTDAAGRAEEGNGEGGEEGRWTDAAGGTEEGDGEGGEEASGHGGRRPVGPC